MMRDNKYQDIFLSRIDEIEKCLENGLYLAALALALTLPDICGYAEYPSEGTGKRYKNWYDRYRGVNEKPNNPYSADMPYLSGEVVYSLRNHFLHSGNPNINKEKIKDELCKIDHFSLVIDNRLLGDTSSVKYGTKWSITERRYQANIELLCRRLCKAAKQYYENNKEKFTFFQYDIHEIH